MKIRYYGVSETGKRDINEDYISVSNNKYFILCDGLGGYDFGEFASKNISSLFLSELKRSTNFNENIFLEKLKFVNNRFVEMKNKSNIPRECSTTLISLIIEENLVYLVNIGDSRLYRLRNKHFIQISKDDSLVYDLYLNNKICRSKLQTLPNKNILTNSIGTTSFKNFQYIAFPYKINDLFLICSDGLSDWVKEARIYELITQNIDLDSIGRQLKQEALQASKDNISFILISFY